MACTEISLPLAGIPKNSPSWVPRMVNRAATVSPSVMTSFFYDDERPARCPATAP